MNFRINMSDFELSIKKSQVSILNFGVIIIRNVQLLIKLLFIIAYFQNWKHFYLEQFIF